VIVEPQKGLIFVPVYNGSYFNGLLKLADQISQNSHFRIVFFFGNSYPRQDEHRTLLQGRFEFITSKAYREPFLIKSRLFGILRRLRSFDEFINFFETANRFRTLNEELRKFWKTRDVVLCLFPANNRYMYSYIAAFAFSRNTPVVIAPQ